MVTLSETSETTAGEQRAVSPEQSWSECLSGTVVDLTVLGGGGRGEGAPNGLQLLGG